MYFCVIILLVIRNNHYMCVTCKQHKKKFISPRQCVKYLPLLFEMFRESDISLEMLLLFCRNAASIYCSNRESHLRDSASRKAAYKKFKGALVLKLTLWDNLCRELHVKVHFKSRLTWNSLSKTVLASPSSRNYLLLL